MAHQIPITLCQLKSRARPERPPRNNVTDLTLCHDHRRGIHRNGPESTSIRKPKLQAPVTARPMARFSLLAPSHRWKFSIFWKNDRAIGDASPSTAPEYTS